MKPFVKWVGSKTKVLPELLTRFPDLKDCIYFEPFVGSGIVFSNIEGPKVYHLRDANEDLIETFHLIQDDPNSLFQLLFIFEKAHTPEFFKMMRKYEPTDRRIRAARFLYLNKTCFNGLYRVNKKGKFNVPIGSYKNPKVLDAENLKNWHHLIRDDRKYKFAIDDFKSIENCFPIGEKVFCYCDPPFDQVFSSYTKEGFDRKDQERLLAVLEARQNGIGEFKWMVSNSNTPFIRNLYKNYNIEIISTSKSVKGGRPQKAEELIIRNYENE